MNISLIITEENMVQLILTILHVMDIIPSIFIRFRRTFKQTWVFIENLFHLEKLYVKELIFSNQYYSHYYVLQKSKYINTIVYLRTTINGNINVLCYDSKYIVPQCLMSISKYDYNTLSPLHTPMRENDIIIYENNLREGIEFERYVPIGTQDTI